MNRGRPVAHIVCTALVWQAGQTPDVLPVRTTLSIGEVCTPKIANASV